ncbi:MAG: RDD family protein [Opitutaceae bacterium]
MSAPRVNVLQVRTPEGVSFSFRLASPVLRLAALIIDLAAVAAAWSVIATILSIFQLISKDLVGLVTAVGYFVLSEGYSIFTEWRWRGQTIGKRLLRLRVVDEGGLRLTFAQVVLRNLLRFVDVLPFAYLVGGLTAVLTRRGQRLGDLAAGTLVIWEPAEALPNLSAWQGEKYNSLRTHGAVVARLRQAVSPAEARAAWQALARREELEPDARVRLFAELAGHFRALTPMPPEAVDGISDEQFMRNVVDVLYLSRS